MRHDCSSRPFPGTVHCIRHKTQFSTPLFVQSAKSNQIQKNSLTF
nr:MAG TPA: hypothetical protein [Caudoviricetes sp.]